MEIYIEFEKWLSKLLENDMPDNTAAYNFNIYEEGDETYGVQLIASDEFSEDDDDWACSEIWSSEEEIFYIDHSDEKDADRERGLEFKRYKLAGTGGQCLMTPPEGRGEDTPVLLYNLGGVIFNLILSLVCLYFYFAHPDVVILSCTLLLTGVLSAFTLFTNGIPMYIGGIANDGMNALSLRKDKSAKTAFLNQLRMNRAQICGQKLSDMPDEWFAIPDGADRQNTAYSSIAVFRVNRSFESLDTLKSEKEIKDLLNSDWNIIGLYRNLLNCDLAYCRLVNYGSSADVGLVNTPEMVTFRKTMKKFMSVIRTEYALSLIHDGNTAEAEKKLALFETAAKTSPYIADINVERELIALAKGSEEKRKIKNKTEQNI